MERLIKQRVQSRWAIGKVNKLIRFSEDDGLGEDGIDQITTHDLSEVLSFNLTQTSLTEISFRHLLRVNWNNLSDLHLGRNKLGNQGCRIISQLSIPNLRQLYLYKNQIDDAGIVHLTKGNLKKILLLDLNENHLTSVGYSLVCRIYMPSIVQLRLKSKSEGQREQNEHNILNILLIQAENMQNFIGNDNYRKIQKYLSKKFVNYPR